MREHIEGAALPPQAQRSNFAQRTMMRDTIEGAERPKAPGRAAARRAGPPRKVASWQTQAKIAGGRVSASAIGRTPLVDAVVAGGHATAAASIVRAALAEQAATLRAAAQAKAAADARAHGSQEAAEEQAFEQQKVGAEQQNGASGAGDPGSPAGGGTGASSEGSPHEPPSNAADASSGVMPPARGAASCVHMPVLSIRAAAEKAAAEVRAILAERAEAERAAAARATAFRCHGPGLVSATVRESTKFLIEPLEPPTSPLVESFEESADSDSDHERTGTGGGGGRGDDSQGGGAGGGDTAVGLGGSSSSGGLTMVRSAPQHAENNECFFVSVRCGSNGLCSLPAPLLCSPHILFTVPDSSLTQLYLAHSCVLSFASMQRGLARQSAGQSSHQ